MHVAIVVVVLLLFAALGLFAMLHFASISVRTQANQALLSRIFSGDTPQTPAVVATATSPTHASPSDPSEQDKEPDMTESDTFAKLRARAAAKQEEQKDLDAIADTTPFCVMKSNNPDNGIDWDLTDALDRARRRNFNAQPGRKFRGKTIYRTSDYIYREGAGVAAKLFDPILGCSYDESDYASQIDDILAQENGRERLEMIALWCQVLRKRLGDEIQRPYYLWLLGQEEFPMQLISLRDRWESASDAEQAEARLFLDTGSKKN